MLNGSRVLAFLAVAAAGCGAPVGAGSATESSSGGLSSCAPGAPLRGAPYDVTRSRFAFGSQPTRDDANGFERWVGVDGVVAIDASGGELGSLNGGAPEATLPDWSADPAALTAHVRAYFETFGVDACQDQSAQIDGGSGGRTVGIARAVDQIPVAESLAYARFDDADQSTSEGFFWPTVPADVVTNARALRDQLTDPTALAAYKAKLPAAAQGDGQVVIHHTSSFTTGTLRSAATYDVLESGGDLGQPSMDSFDADGNQVPNDW